jgi:hypothetical protein
MCPASERRSQAECEPAVSGKFSFHVNALTFLFTACTIPGNLAKKSASKGGKPMRELILNISALIVVLVLVLISCGFPPGVPAD